MGEPSLKDTVGDVEPEVYSLGDGDIQPVTGESFPPPKRGKSRGGGVMPWLLLVLVLGVVGAGIFYVVLPMRARLIETENSLGRLTDDNAKLAASVQRMTQDQAELQAMRDELVTELEQKTAALEAVQRAQEELAKKLADEVRKGEIAITQLDGQLSVDVSDQVLFDSGEAELNDRGKGVLKRVGETLMKLEDKALQIGGHTDAVPISPKLVQRFPSNWELSAARATNVVRFLQDEVKIPGERLIAAGFSQYRPAAANNTPTGRRKNRRIEVKLVPVAVEKK